MKLLDPIYKATMQCMQSFYNTIMLSEKAARPFSLIKQIISYYSSLASSKVLEKSLMQLKKELITDE